MNPDRQVGVQKAVLSALDRMKEQQTKEAEDELPEEQRTNKKKGVYRCGGSTMREMTGKQSLK